MSTEHLNFLEQNSSKDERVSASNDFVNLTLRADAECQVLCDGDFLVLLNANQIVKEKVPTGQHILQFISISRPDMQVEKIVDFPEAGKNYLVLVNELAALMKETETKMSVENSVYVPEQVLSSGGTQGDESEDVFGRYLDLAENGDTSVLIKIANCFLKGVEGAPQMLDEASIYFNKVIERSEDVHDLHVAVQALKDLAGQGCTEAQEYLGMYYQGYWAVSRLEEHNILQKDDELSVYWFEKAANGGSTYAMTCLGSHYEDDFDDVKAEYWYKRAVQEGGGRDAIEELINYYFRDGRDDKVTELCKEYGLDIQNFL